MGKKKRKAAVPNKKAGTSRRSALEASLERTKEHSSNSSSSYTDSKLKGILNSGNTCFFNSVLQSLYATDPLGESFSSVEETDWLVTTQFTDTMKNMRGSSSGKSSVNASNLLNAISKRYPQFKGRRQQDSHELMLCLLSALDEEANGNKESTHVRTLNDWFTSKLVSVVKCSCCGYAPCAIEDYCVVSLQLPGTQHLMTPPPELKKPWANDRKVKTKGGSKKSTSESNREKDLKTSDIKDIAVYGSGFAALNEDVDDLTMEEKSPSELVDNIDDDIDEGVDAGAEEAQRVPATGNNEIKTIKIIEPPEPVLCGDRIPKAWDTTSVSLEDCIARFTSTETLSEAAGNAYNCPNCSIPKGDVQPLKDATRRILFLSPPADVLVFHLKRLLPGGKASTHVSFSEKLNMTPYVGIVENNKGPEAINDGAESTFPTFAESDRTQAWNYQLIAVIVHGGGQYGGHYVAYVRHRRAPATSEGALDEGYVWYYTSDASVRISTLKEVLGCQAYMLFYEREPALAPILEKTDEANDDVVRTESMDEEDTDSSIQINLKDTDQAILTADENAIVEVAKKEPLAGTGEEDSSTHISSSMCELSLT